MLYKYKFACSKLNNGSGVMKTAQKTLLATILAALVTPFAAQAQLEEIIVTAQKREQSLQDVSIAISAFDSAQLTELGLTSVEQLATITPTSNSPMRGVLVCPHGSFVVPDWKTLTPTTRRSPLFSTMKCI